MREREWKREGGYCKKETDRNNVAERKGKVSDRKPMWKRKREKEDWLERKSEGGSVWRDKEIYREQWMWIKVGKEIKTTLPRYVGRQNERERKKERKRERENGLESLQKIFLPGFFSSF